MQEQRVVRTRKQTMRTLIRYFGSSWRIVEAIEALTRGQVIERLLPIDGKGLLISRVFTGPHRHSFPSQVAGLCACPLGERRVFAPE